MSGNISKSRHPFNHDTSQMAMIPNAMDGVISPDGKRIAFVRDTNGNYDIWMQGMDGGNLTRLTTHPMGNSNPYGARMAAILPLHPTGTSGPSIRTDAI